MKSPVKRTDLRVRAAVGACALIITSAGVAVAAIGYPRREDARYTQKIEVTVTATNCVGVGQGRVPMCSVQFELFGHTQTLVLRDRSASVGDSIVVYYDPSNVYSVSAEGDRPSTPQYAVVGVGIAMVVMGLLLFFIATQSVTSLWLVDLLGGEPE